MWFEKLTGFLEKTPDQVRANLELNGDTITSKVNGNTYVCGRLEVPTLADLRKQIVGIETKKGRISIKELVADVRGLHLDVFNEGALFQAASQFNLLEMVAPSVTPEEGIAIYEDDLTQGPACAIACGAGTIYRNYLVPVDGQIGQSATKQIDCLQDIGKLLGNEDDELWQMQNGYALANEAGLDKIAARIQAMSEGEKDELRQVLRIGIQWDTQVTLKDCQHTVTQVYCSALPVAYNAYRKAKWTDFAQIILDATYEATFCAAALNFAKTGNNKVYLTMVGGGVFGNDTDWILSAIKRAVKQFLDVPLEVAIVSYGASQAAVRVFCSAISHVDYSRL